MFIKFFSTDRLEKIQINSEKWKTRVEPTDAKKFKISGYSEDDPPKLPFIKSDSKKSPPMVVFKSDNIHSLKLTKSTSTTSAFNKTTEEKKKSFNRSYSVQDSKANGHVEKILLPTNDDEETFKNFFPKVDRCEIDSPVDMVDMADFDDIKIETTKLSYKKITQGPKRRKPATNPIKNLANRIDICNEYTEIITDQCDSPSIGNKNCKLNYFSIES